MKIVSSNIQPSSTEETEAIVVKVTKTYSSTLQASTNHSTSSQVADHRNDDNEVNLNLHEDVTVDERDNQYSIASLSFDETAATVATNLGGGCGLFSQMSNKFNDDRSDRSTVIFDMVDDIEQELHERFFASHDDEEEDGDESSVDTDPDMFNKSHSDVDTVEDDDDKQEDTVNDGQDVTVDSMPSASSTTVSSKASTRSKTSTIQGSKSLDTTGLSEVDDDDDDGDSTTIDTDQHSADDSHATAKTDDNGMSWFGGLFSSTPSGNNQEQTSVDQEEAAKSVVEEEANEEDTLPAVTAEETESQTKSGGSWFGGFFSNTTSPADEPVASIDKEESPMEEKDESNQEEVAKSIGEVEKPVQDEEHRSAKDILSRVKEVSALVAEVFNLPLSLVDEEKSTTVKEEEKKSSILQEEEPTPVVKDIFAVVSSSTMGSLVDDINKGKENKEIETKSSGTADNHAPSSIEEKVSKQKKRSWRKIASKKIRSILHTKKTAN